MSSPRDFRVNGFVTAPFTPFATSGAVNFEKLDEYIDHLVRYGCRDVFINGTTAECFSLTIDERKKLTEAWIQKGKGKLNSVIIHVTALSIIDAQELAKHAEEVGASAIGCMLPCYHKPESEGAMVEWLQQIAASAPSTPFYYYDINFMSGNKVDLPRLFGLLVDAIPTLCGMKNSSLESPPIEAACKLYGETYQMLAGTPSYMEQIRTGVLLPVSHHVFAPIHKIVTESLAKGDQVTAQQWEDKMKSVYNIRAKHEGTFGALKAILHGCGIDLGPCRPPYKSPQQEEYQEILDEVKATGFNTWYESLSQ